MFSTKKVDICRRLHLFTVMSPLSRITAMAYHTSGYPGELLPAAVDLLSQCYHSIRSAPPSLTGYVEVAMCRHCHAGKTAGRRMVR